MQVDEWKQLRATLRAAGVSGADDVGRFVNDTRHVERSVFDEQGALPVLLEALPHLTDSSLVGAVAGHLRRPWARPVAFDPLRAAFVHWAPLDANTGWAIGDALGSVATVDHVEDLLVLCADRRYGSARQMVVYSLRRYKHTAGVADGLTALVEDPDVGLHAMSALRAVIGKAEVIPVLRRVASAHPGTSLGSAAERELRKAGEALDRP